MKAWLGLGSNLRNPVAQLKDALGRLGSAEGIKALRTSCLYRTPPWGDEQQDDFINAVVQIETSLIPVALLGVLQSVENAMGRQRSGRRWGPRLIDIDLLLYGDQQFQSDELEIPHPRMHERAFVLMPLCELDASVEIPGHGTAGGLLERLDCSGIFCLNDGETN
ncbi:MAG: 2-amino-4-hydroxy-6-hydroxymethyldihydropteridine diphosphokinase [Xanthomonadales bacterium]|nr:2-amino-4-hydroxy-6-hydroxymethyldihydropteridine diphosphokinase [Xanthomonadales bacterium]MDH4020531.1 2-amino-4-hydroxy-6-hydroxymethyldihydropteridine diphosphokinase [Xanthomonadales bacterium]